MTLEVIPSDAFVINADGADEGLEFSLGLRSVVLTILKLVLTARETLKMYIIRA